MPDEKKTEVVQVYMTPKFKARIDKAAEAERRSASDWAVGVFLKALDEKGN